MTREEAKEAAKVMEAYVDGKEVQYLNDDNQWITTYRPLFNWDRLKYRIKTEPKYRPFNTAEECWNEARKHNDFPWIKHVDGAFTQIKNIGKYEVKVEYSDRIREEYLFDETFNAFTFTDGEPFGIKVE